MKEAVLRIFYKDKFGKLHCEPQGKFYYLDGKPVYLADMTTSKWWRNFSGYSISKQILNAFTKIKIRPQIIYRIKEKAILYFATPTLFTKKGILVPYTHEQYVLPIKNFKAKQGDVYFEPKDLPVMNLDDWIKTSTQSACEPMSERERFYQMYAFQ